MRVERLLGVLVVSGAALCGCVVGESSKSKGDQALECSVDRDPSDPCGCQCCWGAEECWNDEDCCDSFCELGDDGAGCCDK